MTADVARQQLIDAATSAVVGERWGVFPGEVEAGGDRLDWEAARDGYEVAVRDDMTLAVAAILDPAHRELVLTAIGAERGDHYEQVEEDWWLCSTHDELGPFYCCTRTRLADCVPAPVYRLRPTKETTKPCEGCGGSGIAVPYATSGPTCPRCDGRRVEPTGDATDDGATA